MVGPWMAMAYAMDFVRAMGHVRHGNSHDNAMTLP